MSPKGEVIFNRHCLHGGPVTVVAIRFPPTASSCAARFDDETSPHKPGDLHNTLKSQGRLVFSRGPWVESHPLFPYWGAQDAAANCTSPRAYRILAFRGGSEGSSTIENISGMIFPSSSSSLTHMNANSRRQTDDASLISVIAYGGRRMSFLRGGGLWDALQEANGKSDFTSIPIVNTDNSGNKTTCSCLEVSDWIHDARMLEIEPKQHNEKRSNNHSFLVAMGTINNNCEVWGFRSTSEGWCTEVELRPSRLLYVSCDVRCMLYSLSFYGWHDEAGSNSCAKCDSDSPGKSVAIPSLIAASGTIFGEIVVWGIIHEPQNKDVSALEHDNLSCIANRWLSDSIAGTTPRIRVAPSYRLLGHLGSVFSIKFGGGGNYIASTSDDRSVRLWALAPINAKDKTNMLACKSAMEIVDAESTHSYDLVWTGWGHTARVWDVSFAYDQSDLGAPLLVSAGEDSTARLWSPLTDDKAIANPLRGHRCESLWAVSASEGIIITGGNDGCIKLHDLKSRARPKEASVRTFVVPEDPRPAAATTINDNLLGTAESQFETTKSGITKRKKLNKKMNKGQAICGMQFYSGNYRHDKLLVSTRAGGLFSFDMLNNEWLDHGVWSNNIVSASDKMVINIDPSTGTCMCAHPSGENVVIGTTEGWLVNLPLSESPPTTHLQRNVAFNTKSHRPVQSLSFMDSQSLIVFYARGSVIWYDVGTSPPTPLHVMTLEAKGIPLSYAYDDGAHAMYIGDSRGNISFFDLATASGSMGDDSETPQGQKPASILKAHDKEHVTSLAVLKTGVIVSVGNDSCLHQCTRDAHNNLQTILSIPTPNVTGLRYVWNVSYPNGSEGVLLGGFYGNDFILFDSINGYEFVRISTGGRQQRQDLCFSFSNDSTASLQCPDMFGMAILTGQKEGQSKIDFYFSNSFHSKLANMAISSHTKDKIQTIYSVGSPSHAETINDLCWVECSGSIFLLTGSNDCTVKLSKLEGSNFVSTVELPSHESCVRGVCSSQHSSSSLTLLATCGGKLSLEFYILRHQTPHATSKQEVSLLCSYRVLGKATIDHRMNAVRATSLYPPDKQCHLALAGDSDGNLHLCIISEHATVRRTTIGTVIQGNGRPVLCLELIRCNDTIIAFVGTTGGDILVWAFPGGIDKIAQDSGAHELAGPIPTSPIHIFRAHQTGVNDLSVVLKHGKPTPTTTEAHFGVVVCSVGDDQTLSVCELDFSGESHQSNESISIRANRSFSIKGASASALQAVHLVCENDFYRIYTSGHDGEIKLWHLDINLSNPVFRCVLSSPIGTEGSCVDCIHMENPDGSIREVIAMGGEGVDLQSIDINILHAAISLKQADYLLITTGAGFSADSGLTTYECAPASYKEMCDPSKLLDDPYNFQQFWLNFAQSYLQTKPHRGYELLDQWCHGGRLKNLRRSSSRLETPWWVYSSNVDSHLRMFESFGSSLCEIHGSALMYKCACGIGYSEGGPRIGNRWDKWNQKVNATESCHESTVRVDGELLSSIMNSDQVFLCSDCQQTPMRPNVLMFNDTDDNVLKEINVQRERYQHWEGSVEEEVVSNNERLVIMEIGCGTNVPAVRHESEEVLIDCAKKIKSQGSHGSVCLIRINPKDAKIEVDDGSSLSFRTISIPSTAEKTLRKIDCWLKALDGYDL